MFRYLIICSLAFIVQQVTAQCIGTGYNGIIADGVSWAVTPWEAGALVTYPAIREPCGAIGGRGGLTLGTLEASACRGFDVRSASPFAPTGVSVASENVFDGIALVQGTLPFLSAAVLEGALPSVGSGIISYGCGNGDVVMLTEEVGPATYSSPAYAPFPQYELGIGGYVGPAIGYSLGHAPVSLTSTYGGCGFIY